LNDDIAKTAARSSATGKERIDALDGLRALALLIIMGYHFGVGWLGGGFFSLDIFYVLSGYLITGLLVNEYRKRSAIKLSAFWLRRARRLLPALLVVLVSVTLLVRFVSTPGLYVDFRMSALSALFYFSNWWQIAASGNYFVSTGAVSPLTHTWSLAVEEQFYLVWPLVVIMVMKLSRTFGRGLRVLLVASVVGAVASALEMALLYSPTANITRLYFGTDTHAQSILVGAALASTMTLIQMRRSAEGMAPRADARWLRGLLLAVGLAGVAGTLLLTKTMTGTTAFDYQGGFMLSALSAAAIIVGAICVPSGVLARGLSLRPMVWIGTVSYGAYLWHYPVFVYLSSSQSGAHGFWLLVLRFAATFALATASYYLIERPVMYGTFWRSIKAIIPSVVLMGATVAVVIGGTAAEASTIPSVIGSSHIPTPPKGTYTHVLLVGDSTALTLGISLGNLGAEIRYHVSLFDEGMVGCGIAEGSTYEWNGVTDIFPPQCNVDAPSSAQWPALLKGQLNRYRPQIVVLLAGRWETYDRTDLAGHVTNITNASYARYVESEIERFVTIARSNGSRVVLLSAPYFSTPPQPNGQPQPQDQPSRVDIYNHLLAQVARENPTSVAVVNLHRLLTPKGTFTTTVGGLTVRAPDGVHFPYSGKNPSLHDPNTLAQVGEFARWINPRLWPAILEAARER